MLHLYILTHENSADALPQYATIEFDLFDRWMLSGCLGHSDPQHDEGRSKSRGLTDASTSARLCRCQEVIQLQLDFVRFCKRFSAIDSCGLAAGHKQRSFPAIVCWRPSEELNQIACNSVPVIGCRQQVIHRKFHDGEQPPS